MDAVIIGHRCLIHWASLLLVAGLTACATTETKVTPVPKEEILELLIGQWQGEWMSRWYRGSGEVKLDITSVQNEQIAGTGVSTGGPCNEPVDITGNLRNENIKIKASTEKCGEVTVFLQMLRAETGAISMVGSWAHPGDGDYGYLELKKLR